MTSPSQIRSLLATFASAFLAAMPLNAQNPPTVTATLLPAAPSYSDTVTVTTRLSGPAGTPQPTGTISYTVDTGSASSAALTSSATASLAYLQINPLAPGAHTLTFYYSGDANYATTQTAPQVQTFTVADLPLAFVSGTYPLIPYLTAQINKGNFVADYYASGVAVDPLGNVFLSSGNASGGTPGITKIGTNQLLSTVPVTGIGASTKLATDTVGNLYIADPANSRVVLYSTAGVQTVLPANGLMRPAAIMFDSANNSLVILDTTAGSIINFNLTTSAQTTLLSGLTQLSGMVATDGKGDLFYVQNKVVMESIPGSTPVPIFGEFSNPDPNVNAYPTALAFNEVTGDLFVAKYDGGTQEVIRIDKLHHSIFVGLTHTAQLNLDSQGELYGTDTVISTGAAADSGPGIFGGDQGLGGALPDSLFTVPYGHSLSGIGNYAGSPSAIGAVNHGGAGGVPELGTITYQIKVTTDNGLTVTVPSYGIGFGPLLAVEPGIVSVTPATFSNIGGVTYLEQQPGYDTLYVSDKAQNTVSSLIFNLNGNGKYPNPYKTLAFLGLNGPTQLAVDGAYDVYVLDSGALNGGSRIVRLDYANNQTIPYTADNGDAAGLLGSVTSFTIDGATNLYLGGTDKNGKGVIVRQDPLGYESKRITTANAPTLLAIDAFHTLFFTDTQGNLLRVDVAGNLTTLATGLVQATSLSLDASDTVYLTSASAETITTVSPAGVVGQVTVPGSIHPALAVAEDLGSLYVADSSLQQVLVDTRFAGNINNGDNINFGTVTVGSKSAQNETLRNVGNLSLAPFTFTVAAPFSIAPGATNGCQDTTGTNPTVLAAGGSCNLQLQYAPTKAATNTGNADIRVTSDLVYGFFGLSDANWNLSGMASTAAVSISPTTITFPSTSVGATSAPLTATLTNGGSSPVSLTAGSLTDSTDFTQSDNCNGQVPAGGSCTITFTFTPGSTGALSSTYSIATGSQGWTVALSGTGTAAQAPQASLSPTSLSFTTVVNTAAPNQTVTLTNAGTATLNIASVAIGGTNASSFTIVTNGCGTTLGAGASCSIAIGFPGLVAGTYSATLNVTDNANPATQTVQLIGSATGIAEAALTPATVSFGNVTVGSNASQTMTLSNAGTASLSISAASGPNNVFALSANTCGTTLAAGATCAYTVTFTPSAVGGQTETFTVADSVGMQSAALSGTGVAPAAPIATLTASASFPITNVGATATAIPLTLSNTGNAALTISSVTLGGSNPGIFADTSACATSLPAGSSCQILVTFTPTSAASFSAALTVTDNSATTTQTATLTGTGVAVATDYMVVAPNSTQTVQPGASAQFSLTIAPVGGNYSQAVALTVTGLPAGATASFNPASVTPGSNGAPSVLSVQTASLTGKLQRPDGGSPVPLFAVLLLLPLLGTRKLRYELRQLPKSARALLLAVLALGATAAITGCGGGYYDPQPQTVTLMVIGTSGTLTHSTTVTLTIQ